MKYEQKLHHCSYADENARSSKKYSMLENYKNAHTRKYILMNNSRVLTKKHNHLLLPGKKRENTRIYTVIVWGINNTMRRRYVGVNW